MDGWEKAKLGVDLKKKKKKKSKCSLNEVKHTGKTNAIKGRTLQLHILLTSFDLLTCTTKTYLSLQRHRVTDPCGKGFTRMIHSFIYKPVTQQSTIPT